MEQFKQFTVEEFVMCEIYPLMDSSGKSYPWMCVQYPKETRDQKEEEV